MPKPDPMAESKVRFGLGPGSLRSYLPLLAYCIGAYTIAGGCVTLAGWFLEIPRMTDWGARGISMFPNAALCAVALGVALCLLAGRVRVAVQIPTSRVLAVLVAILAGLTLSEHITGVDLQIDRMLVSREWGQHAAAAHMRMGLPASISFAIIGTAMLLASLGPGGRRVAAYLALLPIFIASLSLVGYWFGADRLFGVARFTGISWQTSTMVAALALGVMVLTPEHGPLARVLSPDAGGVVVRRLLVPIVAIPLFFGWLQVQGQEVQLFDTAFGSAILSLATIGMLVTLLFMVSAELAEKDRLARTSADRFTRFMESLPGLAWIKDREGRYVYANEAAVKAFNTTVQDLYGHTDLELFPPAIAEAFRSNDRKALHSPHGIQAVEQRVHGGGETHYSLVSKFPMSGVDKGEPALVGGMAIDITDRMRAEEALRDADRRKDEFLATLAHELRNPLGPIGYSVQIFKAQQYTDPDMLWALEVVERQVKQMSRLLEDLLDVSRISYNKLELRKERVDLATVILRTIETSRPQIEGRGHQLQVELAEGTYFLDADPVRLAQIFSNLLNNAAKYTSDGGNIRIYAEQRDATVAVSIRDNGMGIPAELLGKVFELFSQAGKNDVRSQGGLGIGLSLVQGLAELHGGSVEARSEGLGKGSEFIVRLPLAMDVVHPSPVGVPGGGGVTPAGAASGRKLRILVVDDLRDTADSQTMLLRSLGHDVKTAYSGEEALQLAPELRPQVVLLDIGMPGMSGLEACRQLRHEPWSGETLFVATTGWGQEADRRRTRDAGFHHHLIKPVALSDITHLLDEFVG